MSSMGLTGMGKEVWVLVLLGIAPWHPKAGALLCCWPLFLCCCFGLKRNLVSC